MVFTLSLSFFIVTKRISDWHHFCKSKFPYIVNSAGVSVANMQLEVSTALMQVTVSESNMWVTVFIVLMQVGVSVAIMQVVLYAVHKCFCCKMRVTVSAIAMQVTLSRNSFISLSLTGTTFHKRYYILFAYYHFCKYSSKIKIL